MLTYLLRTAKRAVNIALWFNTHFALLLIKTKNRFISRLTSRLTLAYLACTAATLRLRLN